MRMLHGNKDFHFAIKISILQCLARIASATAAEYSAQMSVVCQPIGVEPSGSIVPVLGVFGWAPAIQDVHSHLEGNVDLHGNRQVVGIPVREHFYRVHW